MLDFINSLNNILGGSLQNITFSIKDLIDVIIIAVFIYAVIRFLQKTHAISVVIGIFTLALFYGAAHLFDLALTSLILKYFFSIFLIVIAIIFQRELRRFFSLFGFLGITQRLMPPKDTILETIIKSVFRLSGDKTGALIILPGLESIESLLEGGLKLNGDITESLILSIFNKNAPAHDGAILIENNKIKKFAVHLPLSEHIEKVSHFGLRHRAALGLSERSDAFVIIVSETGSVKAAKNGNIFPISNGNQLKEGLAAFYERKFPRLKINNIIKWVTKNIILFGFSLLLASGIFLLTNSKLIYIQRSFPVSIGFQNIPSEFNIGEMVPEEVIVTLEGRGFDFDNLNIENVRASIDLATLDIKKAGWLRIATNKINVRLPFKLKLIKVEPTSIKINVAKNPAEKQQ